MKYSRNRINMAGKALLAGPETGFPYTDASIVVEDWRKLHLLPLKALVDEITTILFKNGINAAFSSHRLNTHHLDYIKALSHQTELGQT